MWGVGHQKISCNYMQNNKCEGGQGEAATGFRFIIVPIEEEEENNDDDINDVYEDDDENDDDDDNDGSGGVYDDDKKNNDAKQYTYDLHRGINSI
jgi:hypothetical protein